MIGNRTQRHTIVAEDTFAVFRYMSSGTAFATLIRERGRTPSRWQQCAIYFLHSDQFFANRRTDATR